VKLSCQTYGKCWEMGSTSVLDVDQPRGIGSSPPLFRIADLCTLTTNTNLMRSNEKQTNERLYSFFYFSFYDI
jgi:hypothetical protein